jgi:FAD/FMN-containing dehydrogenase
MSDQGATLDSVTQQREVGLPLATDLEVITGAADDFGHLVHKVPAVVAKPRDPEEIARVVKYATGQGITVVPRGAGHSVYGQAQCDGGIVCDLTRLDSVTVGSSRVIAGAGATWSHVLDAALAHGLTPPVLTDYLDLTVGGTLSAGGIGGASHRYGPQVDNVAELDVVTARGDLVACSPLRRPEVFFTALGGRGHGGIIVRATFPVIAARQRARVHQIPCPTAGDLVTLQLKLAGERRADYVEGHITLDETGGWQFTAELATFHDGSPVAVDQVPGDVHRAAVAEDITYLDFCQGMAPGVRLLAATGDWYRPHPWISVFLPAGAVEQYVTSALAELTPETLGPIPILLYPIRRGPVPAPGLQTPLGADLFFAFTILRTTATETATQDALAHNTRLAEAAVAVGGTVYGISAIRGPG